MTDKTDPNDRFEKIVSILKRDFEFSPSGKKSYLLLAEGDILDSHWLDYIEKHVIEALRPLDACMLPAAREHKRDLSCNLGTIGVKDKFTYYAFNDQLASELMKKSLEKEGHKVHSIKLTP